MKTGKAFFAGILGGAVMSAIMFLARLMGMEVNLEMMLGTVLLAPGAVAWVTGLVMHLLISGLIALLYAWGFEHVSHRAGWRTGLLFSLAHIGIAGVFMGAVLPAMHRLVPETMPMPAYSMATPGYFMLNLGLLGVLAFVMLHAIYGGVVGTLYGPVLHPGAAYATR